MPARAAIQTLRNKVTVLPEPRDAEHGHGQPLLGLGNDHFDDPAAPTQPWVEVAAGVGDAQGGGPGGVGGLVVAAGGPGNLADGMDLGDQGLALAVGAPVGPGGQPLPPRD
jgi:hypothetical protein